MLKRSDRKKPTLTATFEDANFRASQFSGFPRKKVAKCSCSRKDSFRHLLLAPLFQEGH